MIRTIKAALAATLILSMASCTRPTPQVHPSLPQAAIVDADDTNFQQIVDQARQPVVLVDVWATWCGPCRMIKPIVEEAAGKFAGKLLVVRVDADKAPTTAKRYAAEGLPTLVVLNKACKSPATQVGYPGDEQETANFIAGAVNGCDIAKPQADVDRTAGAGLFVLRASMNQVYTEKVPPQFSTDVKKVQDAFDVYVRRQLADQGITKPTHKQLAGAYADMTTATITAADPLIVGSVQPHSPAQKAGILAADKIVAIDGVSVYGRPFEACMLHLHGTANSALKLSIERPVGSSVERMEVSLQRGKVSGLFD